MSQTGLACWKSVCGLVVAMIGLSALAGWGTGQRSLAGIRADFIPMAPITAPGFVLVGIALVVLPGDGTRLWRKVIAVGTAGVAGFRLAEYLLSINLGVHGWPAHSA